MSTSIHSDINELNSLDVEITRINDELKKLKKQKKKVEERIIQFLKFKNQQGFKYGNNAILLEEKTKKLNKNKKEHENETMNILREHGIEDPEKVLQKIKDAKLSDNTTQLNKIKVTKLK
jgi:glutamine synthetase adenylyltransferase